MSDAPRYVSIRDYLQVLKKRRWMILVITVLFGAAAYIHDHGETKVYESSTTLSYSDQTLSLGAIQAIVPQDVAPDQRAAIHAQSIMTLPVAQRAARILRVPSVDAGDLLGSVSASTQATTDFVIVTASGGNPYAAATLANAFGQAAVQQATATLQGQYTSEAAAVEREIKALGTSPSTAYYRALDFSEL
jgi:capsular polysaccharide biosynthesis protein